MDAFAAIADPIRREILDILRQEPREAGAIARRFPISRPAISRHLRILREAGLVSADLDGRRRIYRVNASPMAEIDAWLAPYRELSVPTSVAASAGTWESRLDALGTEVFRTQRERRQSAASHSVDTSQQDKEQSA